MEDNKALFLDRDGVINIDKHHLYKIEECEFIDGIFDVCKEAKDKGYKLIVVTNQAGIAKEIYTEKDFNILMNYIKQQFKEKDCELDDVFFCPFHPDGKGKYKKNSEDRKPNPGMIIKAAIKHQLNLKKSIIIGDAESDIETGINAGIGKTIRFLMDTQIKGETQSKADIIIHNNLRQMELFL